MKTKKPILRLVALAALSFFTGNEIVAQTNIGAACGCPAVGSRTAGSILTEATNAGVLGTLPSSAYGYEITGNLTLTCDKIWTIDQKIYVGPGATLTIQPGTVIKGGVAGSVAAATALIIERGGKIVAPGTESCPIVFTAAADPLDGTYPVTNKGMWGGVLICGKATNNLTLAANGPFVPGQAGKMAVSDGVGVLEGFASSLPQDQFGASTSATAPTGYAIGTSPSGNFTFAGTATSPQNNNTGTVLVVTSTSSVLNSAINGLSITGTGIPANTTVTTSAASTSFALSNPATANLSGSYVIGNAITEAGSGLTASTALTLANSNSSIIVGMAVSGTGIASGTTVSAVSGTAVTLSASSTAAMTGNYNFTFTFTAADVLNCAGATKIKISSPVSTIAPGLTVTGTNVATSTSVTAITLSSGNVQTFTVSPALTGTITSISFGGTYPSPGVTAYFPITTTTATPAGFANGSSSVYVNYAGQSVPTSQQSFDDNDNSGIMTYVSIRHSGANLLVGSEINGLTLASVGRGTKIEHIEIVSCADDNIEIFGGTVNLKYCTTLFGNDDMFDYDLGWTGKAQFLFGMKANQFTTGTTSSGISSDNDNGFEMDSDDSQSYNFPRSIPVIYNATIIGNDKIALSSDNTSLAAINAKENTGGEIYNSLFANFRNGFNLKKSLGSASSYAKGGEAWHNWINTGVTTTSSATGTSGSTTLTLGAANASIASGMSVIGTGIATGTTVSSVSGTTVTLSAATTAAMSGNYTFTNASASVGNGTQILKVKCNTFLNNMSTGTPLAASIGAGSTSGTAFSTSELAQFTTTDKNIEVNSLTGFNPAFVINGTSNVVTTKNDVVPSVSTNVQLGSGCAQAPMDGFFEPANYRGAFAPGASNDNWLSDWTYSQVLNSTSGVTACPTDINNDGVTDVNDFLIFSGQFGQACN